MSQFIKCILLIINGFVLFSCATHKKLVEAEDFIKLDRKKTNEIVFAVDSISKSFPIHFYTKIKTSYSDTNRSNTFKTSIRMAKDSAIQALVTYASIPIINTIITKDSLRLANKRDKCYIKQDLGFFKDQFGVDFNYKNIEEIILGLPVDYDTNQKYFQIHDHKNYILSSHRKLQMRRAEKKAKDNIIIKYFLNSSLSCLESIKIESPSDSTHINVFYKERELINGFNSPKEVLINILTPRNNISIEMSYDKVDVNLPQLIEMIIPESYEKCE